MNRTSAVSKTLVFRWHKKFQDGFSKLKDGSRPGQPKTVVTNANIAAVAGLLNRGGKTISHSVGISSGSAHKNLTQQLKLRGVFARCTPLLDRATHIRMHIYFFKSGKILTNLVYQNYLRAYS